MKQEEALYLNLNNIDRMKGDPWLQELLEYCDSLLLVFDTISTSRKYELEQVGHYICRKNSEGQLVKLIVICTHNSRRSHFGQIWLSVAAKYYGVNIESYSGGIQATAFHPNAVRAIRRCGFDVTSDNDLTNPVYSVSYSNKEEPLGCYSKKFYHSNNPSDAFGAILVCNDAAEACPFVSGAETRFVLPYNDPKAFDGTALEDRMYDERCREIGIEMFYIMQSI